MESITLQRHSIACESSPDNIRATLSSLPAAWYVQTHYVPATDTEGAFIVATCKDLEACCQVPYSYELNSDGAHYAAALTLVRKVIPHKVESLSLLCFTNQKGGYLFTFSN